MPAHYHDATQASYRKGAGKENQRGKERGERGEEGWRESGKDKATDRHTHTVENSNTTSLTLPSGEILFALQTWHNLPSSGWEEDKCKRPLKG